MSLPKFKTLQALLWLCIGLCLRIRTAEAAPAARFDDNLIRYPQTPSEVLAIDPLLIYPEQQNMFYQARTLDGDGERDIIFVKLLQDKSNGYRPKQQRLNEKEKEKNQRRKELSLKDIFFVKARANGQFSHERLKVYRLPEFYAISVYHNDEK